MFPSKIFLNIFIILDKKHCRICCPENEIFKNERYRDTSKNPRCLFCFKKFNGDNADLFQHHLNMHTAFKFLLEKDMLQLGVTYFIFIDYLF